MLVAMNPAALKANAKWLKRTAMVLVNEDAFDDLGMKKAGFTGNPFEELHIEDRTILCAPITRLTEDSLKYSGLDTVAVHKCKNMSDDPKFDEIYLSNYTTLNIQDRLRRVPGVGVVSNVGSRYYAMQIWVQPDKMASLGITVKDLQSALKDQNREAAAGVLGQQPITDGIDPGASWNWRRFDGGYGVTAGLSHRFDFRKPVYYGENRGFGKWFVEDSFIDVEGGAQFYGGGRSASDADMTSSVREHVALGYGRWLSGPLGVRVSGFISGNAWDNEQGSRQKSNLAGLRGEVMFDPPGRGLQWHKSH